MKKELLIIFAAMTLAGCAFQEKRVEQSLAQPINCASPKVTYASWNRKKLMWEGKWSPA